MPVVSSDLRRKKHLKRFQKAQGEAPACLGHYRAGDPECDGVPACQWRSGCRAFRDWCGQVGSDPEAVKTTTPRTAVLSLVFDLLQAGQVAFHVGGDRSVRAWGMFLEAFQDALPASIVIAPNFDAAVLGDLYIAMWGAKDQAVPTCFLIHQRSGNSAPKYDRTLVRYFPGPAKRIRPRIELRGEVHLVLAKWPQIELAAERWTYVSRCGKARTGALRCVAVGVKPERIHDFGRLAAAMLLSGSMKKLHTRFPRRRVRVEGVRDDAEGGDLPEAP